MDKLDLTVERIDESSNALITNLFEYYLHDMAEWFLFDTGDDGQLSYDMSKHWATQRRGLHRALRGKTGRLYDHFVGETVFERRRRPRRRGVLRHTTLSAHGRRRSVRENDLGHAPGSVAGPRIRRQPPGDSILAQDHCALHARHADRRTAHRQRQSVGVLSLQEQRMSGGVDRVLFVCTGNIFRSLTAEYALRDALLRMGRTIHRRIRRHRRLPARRQTGRHATIC